jgi:hypothetical protein
MASDYINNIYSKKVLGAPPRFSGLTDPNCRIYGKKIIHNPPIVTILPGRPNFTTLTDTENAEITSEALQKIKDGQEISNDGGSTAGLEQLVQHLVTNNRDQRYYSFKPTVSEYLAGLNQMLARMASRINLENSIVTNPSKSITMVEWGGLQLYCNKASSISESASNEYGESFLEQMTNGLMSNFAREAEMVLNGAFGGSGTTPEAVTSARETAEARAFGAISKGTMGGVGSLLSGSRLLLPKIWKASSFNKNYSLSFKFETPYGDINSVYYDVISPFLAILALSLPRQVHTAGYEEPFIVRMDSAGWFTIECGVITDITIKRSPDEGDWTRDGLARVIEIDMSVTDVYPALMLSFEKTLMDNNFGLSQYLDSIAGLDYRQVQDKGTLKQIMTETINRSTLGISGQFEVGRSKVNEALSKGFRLFG